MSIANALGIADDEFMKMLEEYKNFHAVKYSEQAFQRKLTDEEMEKVVLDCEVSKKLNIGNTEHLRKYGIEL